MCKLARTSRLAGQNPPIYQFHLPGCILIPEIAFHDIVFHVSMFCLSLCPRILFPGRERISDVFARVLLLNKVCKLGRSLIYQRFLRKTFF